MTQSLRTHRKSTDKEANEMASSNDIEVLDPTASVEKLKNIVSKVALNRRHFMAALGAAGVAAGTGLVTRRDAHAQQPTPNGFLQVDVLNFLLNIKYLKATFYSYITQGVDLPASSYVTLGSNQIYNVPSQVTTFSSQINDMFNEMYYDELNQLVDLRNIIGNAAVSRPLINLAGTSAANTTFAAPSATMTLTAVQAIAQARMLEDVSVTAFAGALTYLTGSNLAIAAQILSVDGCHAAALRLASIQNNAPYQGTLYQSSFQVVTTSGSPNIFSVLTSTKAVPGDIITGIGIPQGSVVTAITAAANATPTGIVVTGSSTITGVSSVTGLLLGQPISGTGIPASTTIAGITSNTITISQKTTLQTSVAPTGYSTSGSSTITGVSSISGLIVGQAITGSGIPTSPATTIVAASGTTITMSQAANATPLVTFTGVLNSGSSTITPVGSTSGVATGQVVTGTGITAGTTITNIGSNLTLSGPASASSPTTNIVTFNGIVTSGSANITNVASTTTGLVVGQPLTAGVGIAVGTTIKTLSLATNTVTMSANASASNTVSTTGTATSGSNILTNIQSTNGLLIGQPITGANIPAGATITALGTTAPFSITMSGPAFYNSAGTIFTALTTSGSNLLTSVSSTSGLVVGQPVAGAGIPTGTTIAAFPLAVSFNALTTSGSNVLASVSSLAELMVGQTITGTGIPANTVITAFPTPVTFTFNAITANGSNVLTSVSSTTGLAAGQALTGTGIPANTVITAIGTNTVTMSANATATITSAETVSAVSTYVAMSANATATITSVEAVSALATVVAISQNATATLTPASFKGTTTSASNVLTAVSSVAGLAVGQALLGTGIPANTVITAVGTNTVTMSANATAAGTAVTITTATNFVCPIIFNALATSGSNLLTNVQVAAGGSVSGLVVGQPISGTGIPAGTVITVLGTAAPFTVTMSNTATATTPVASFLCDQVSGSPILINVSTTAGLAVGQPLVGASGIPNNAVITAIGTNTITMSQNATYSIAGGQTVTTAQFVTSPAQTTVTSPAMEPIYSGGTVLTSPTLTALSSATTEALTIGLGSITISQPATASGFITATIATTDPYEVVPYDPGTAALAAAGPVPDPTSSPAEYQGFFATPGSSNASSTSPAGFAYARTFSQVLGVLYGNTAISTYEGGFFPIGVAGNINVT
jgi:hypothetical protein